MKQLLFLSLFLVSQAEANHPACNPLIEDCGRTLSFLNEQSANLSAGKKAACTEAGGCTDNGLQEFTAEGSAETSN
jgi:hypothetical protein